MDDERRQMPRQELRLPLTVRIRDDYPVERETYTRDVSSSGLSFRSPRRFRPGTEMECTLTLPPETVFFTDMKVNYRAEVVRITPREDGAFDVGVRLHSYAYVTDS